MADSTTNLDTIAVGDSGKEVTLNELVDAGSMGTLFGRHASACAGLTWGYYGGRLWDGSAATAIANGTVSLTNTATNYVEATNAGVVSSNTSAFTAGRIRIAKVVCSGGAVTSYEDHRTYTFPAAAGLGSVTSVNITQPAAGITASGGPITSSGSITLALANDLAGLEGLSSNGMAARTGTSTWAVRTITAPAAGITVSDGDGVSGNPTLVLANDLAAVEGLSSTGIVRRTGTSTWSAGTAVDLASEVTGALPISALATIADARVLANISGGAAAAAANTLTGIIDAIIGSTQGTILYRSGSAWVALATGTSGQLLETLGAGANPAWQTQPYDVGGGVTGVPAASAVLLRYPIPRAVIFPASLTGSKGVAGTAATAQTDFDILKNGVSFGTMRFAAAGTTASFISAGGSTFAAGDILTLVAPASPDATLADVGFALIGTR